MSKCKDKPFWCFTFLITLPVTVVPLYVFYHPPDLLINRGYGTIIINEYQKYAAELFTLAISVGVGLGLLVLLGHNRKRSLPRFLVWASLVYGFALGLSLLQAHDPHRGMVVALQVYVMPLLFFLLIAQIQWNINNIKTILWCCLLTATVIAVIGIAQAFEFWPFALALPHLGAGSLLFFQNLAGEYLIILLPIAVTLLLITGRLVGRIAAALVVGLLSMHLVVTLARGAWVGLIGGIVVTAVLALTTWLRMRPSHAPSPPADSTKVVKSFHLRTFLAFGLFLTVMAVVASGSWSSLGNSAYVKELLSINFSNTTGRLQIWSDSLDMLAEGWLVGVGPGHYKVHIPEYLDSIPTISYLFRWDVKSGDLVYPFRPHNDYYQIWLELGVLGLCATGAIFGFIVYSARRGMAEAFRRQDKTRVLLIAGCFCGFSSWAVSMLFEFPFRMPASLLTGWLCAGLTVALSSKKLPTTSSRTPKLVKHCGVIITFLLVIGSGWQAYCQFWSDLYVNQSVAAAQNQDFINSYHWISKAFELTPWKEQAGGTKARHELLMNQPEKALATARQSLQHNPNSLPGLWAYGLAAGALGQEQASRQAFQKIVDTYPFLADIETYRRFANPVQ